MELKLSEDRLKLMTEKVQSYFRNEHDESIGDLKAAMYIEFFLKELGPKIYNQAIDDANVFIQEKLIDLDSTLYITE